MPNNILPYDVDIFSDVEKVRNDVSALIGRTLALNADFRAKVIDRLVAEGDRKVLTYPVLQLLEDDFGGNKGSELVTLANPDLTEIDVLTDLVMRLEPNMALQIPTYVESYFHHESFSNNLLNELSQYKFAVFPEVTITNEQDVFVGYSDRMNGDVVQLEGVRSSGFYDGYIPIHVKRCRFLLVTDDSFTDQSGANLVNNFDGGFSHLSEKDIQAGLSRSIIEQEFLPSGYQLVNLMSAVRFFEKISIDKYIPPGEPGGGFLENCFNGIDDDGDGLIDFNDPDCSGPPGGNGMSCPEDANCYRDCRKDDNLITGAKFKSVNAFFDILNPLLPDLETNTNFRFDFHYIVDISNCSSPCPLTGQVQPHFGHPLSIHIDDVNAPYGPRDYFSEYSPYVDESLSNGNVPFFIAKAIPEGDPRPTGSRIIGNVARFGTVSNRPKLVAYVTQTNWSDMSTPIINVGDKDWDPSIYGDQIHVTITETDILGATREVNETNSSQQTRNFNISLASKIGVKFGDETQANTETSSSFGYSFQNQETRSASTSYTLTSDRIIELGTYTFVYCDSPESSYSFPTMAIIPYAFPSRGTQTDIWSWGWNSSVAPGIDPFSLGQSEALPFETGLVKFITVVSKP